MWYNVIKTYDKERVFLTEIFYGKGVRKEDGTKAEVVVSIYEKADAGAI